MGSGDGWASVEVFSAEVEVKVEWQEVSSYCCKSCFVVVVVAVAVAMVAAVVKPLALNPKLEPEAPQGSLLGPTTPVFWIRGSRYCHRVSGDR